ncbi:hypothetical protein A1O3_09823 [Capronia epimyces CBS 606.96]|uniref:UBC core domain-containing protein n=1 Tax=Capronia epimyces CBS 606.96 TaxID=1182542 RepID=W9XKU5_9EURO|nr:uncharacterized protein A1O3_09823 [Capronia epimyces CBS 606.96]EXJ77596.1 hypothetical protein A1O3_09823 [Capronia epimyces CBS 606.96]
MFPEADDASILADDLTQLVVLVTGAEGTPYSRGLWRLHLKMPHDYPKSPPKAMFKTRIYHPNVEETTGAVCLETLKRDWDPKLTLKDILVTISCLLIQPNPDSALNAAAGALIQEDYEAFSTQAKLMASIHAPIPRHLMRAVQQAKRRGEEDEDEDEDEDKTEVLKKSAQTGARTTPEAIEEDNTKENDPTQRTTSAVGSGTANRGKRPVSDLSPPVDADQSEGQHNAESEPGNPRLIHSDSSQGGPVRKSPKLTRTDAPNRQDRALAQTQSQSSTGEEGKENVCYAKASNSSQGQGVLGSRPTVLRKVSNVGPGRKGQARVGIRRL